jgi:integrase
VLRGHQRRKTLTALRSLTRHCKKNGLIFADPAARIRSTPRPETMILPLPAERISTATEAAVTPAARLTLALAAVHALRPDAVRHLALADIDHGNRRITINGQSRPLDDLTRKNTSPGKVLLRGCRGVSSLTSTKMSASRASPSSRT